MPAQVPVYQDLYQQLHAVTRPHRVPGPSVVRLALLVTGILAAQSCVLARVAADLLALRLTEATKVESIGRRLRRTLDDHHLTAPACYEDVLGTALNGPQLLRGGKRVVLALDESSKADQLHLFRVSLTYQGGSLPLAWAVWKQNTPLPTGRYWALVDDVLARVAALLPPGVEVVVVGDRAYSIPGLIDRLQAYGWPWVLRVTTTGSHRFRDARGREWALSAVLAQQLARPGRRWKAQGWLFKAAGWRAVHVVGVWAAGTKEPLVVVTDLGCRWDVLRLYARRFWIEAGFRTDKAKGWCWEDSQVQGVAHHERLLLALAWASLVVLCQGVAEAEARLAELAARPITTRPPGRPQHPRESVFTLGLRRLRAWFYRTTTAPLRWLLSALDAPSWHDRWRHQQAHRFIFLRPVRP